MNEPLKIESAAPDTDPGIVLPGAVYPIKAVVGVLGAGKRLFLWLGGAIAAAMYVTTSASGMSLMISDNPEFLMVVVPLAVVHILWPLLDVRFWCWSLNATEFVVTSGVLTRRAIAIPLSRVQQVDTRSGIVERALGVARLQVHSAGSRAARVDLPGVPVEQAAVLQAILTEAGHHLATSPTEAVSEPDRDNDDGSGGQRGSSTGSGNG